MRSNLSEVKSHSKKYLSTIYDLRSKIYDSPPILLFKIILSVIIFLIIGTNIYFFFISPDPYIQAKKLIYSFSKGDQYYGRLSLWYLYAKDNQWEKAAALESGLAPVDLEVYKSQNYPADIKKSLNNLNVKKDKTVEDWMEMAALQTKLGKRQDALDSITRAKNLDPIREDINKLYYELSK